MPKQKLPPNARCPCESGKPYGRCCYDKGFEYLVDEHGTVYKAMPVPDELVEALEEQKQRFVQKYGREPGPDDHLFFDAPPVEHLEHHLVQAMKQAGVDPAVIFAFERTGLLVTEENQHLISDRDRAEWEAAVLEYRIRHDDRPEEDTENEWF